MRSALKEVKNALNLEIATKAILSNIDEFDIKELILPDEGKEFYFECAHIISNLPSSIILKYVDELLYWFQDLNWPGVEQIYETVRCLPVDILDNALRKAYLNAVDTSDEEWAYNLCELFPEVLKYN